MVSRGEIGNRHRNSLSHPSLVIIASVSHSALCLNCLLNVKVIENAFNQEKALVGAFSLIAKTDVLFAALGQYGYVVCSMSSCHLVVCGCA